MEEDYFIDEDDFDEDEFDEDELEEDFVGGVEEDEEAEEEDEEAEEAEEESEAEEDTPDQVIKDIYVDDSQIIHKNMTEYEFSRLVETYAELIVKYDLDPIIKSSSTDIIDIAINDILYAREKVPIRIIRKVGNTKMRIKLTQLNLPPRLAF